MNQAIPYTSQSMIGIIVPGILQDTIKDALRGFPNIQPHYFLTQDFIMTDELQQFIYEYEMLVAADPYIFLCNFIKLIVERFSFTNYC